MGTFVQHEPHPACGSSNALGRYEDGSAWCFSCSTFEPATDEGKSKIGNFPINQKLKNFIIGEAKPINSRGISEETCHLYNYRVGKAYRAETKQYEVCHIANYYDNKGELVAQKLRWPDKSFSWIGKNPKQLYGQHVWRNKPGGKYIVITEGELDALCLSSVQNNKWPVLSLADGACKKGVKAVNAIKPHVRWLEDNYETIILMFDMDEEGQISAQEVSLLFSANKCKIAKFSEKDACDMFQAGKVEELISSIFKAQTYRPDAIVSAKDVWESLKVGLPSADAKYPYEFMNASSGGGVFKSHLVTIVAGTGVGKSQFTKEILYSLLQQGEKVTYFALEESKEDAVLGIFSLKTQERLHFDWTSAKAEELKPQFDELFSNDDLYVYNGSFKEQATYDEVLKNIEYCARVLGVKWVIVDHLTMLVSGQAYANERLVIDKISTDLKNLTVNLNIGIFLVCHLNRGKSDSSHENGAEITLQHIRGSHGLAQVSNLVIALERNTQAKDPNDSLTRMRFLKNRRGKKDGPGTGLVGYIKFDFNTGRLIEAQPPTEDYEFPSDPLVEEFYNSSAA